MKATILSLFLLCFGIITAKAQITFSGVNNLKINSTLQDIEKTIGKKIKILGGENNSDFSTKITHNGIDFGLSFINPCQGENTPCYSLSEISTRSDQVRTAENLGVGSSLKELKNAGKKYDKRKQYFSGMSEYKNEFYIRNDKLGTVLSFELNEGKVTKVSLAYLPAD